MVTKKHVQNTVPFDKKKKTNLQTNSSKCSMKTMFCWAPEQYIKFA